MKLQQFIKAVYNQWTGLVDWTGGLDWWTDTKNHFYASNKIHMPIGLHDAPQNSLLPAQDWFDGRLLIILFDDNKQPMASFSKFVKVCVCVCVCGGGGGGEKL